MSGDGPVFIRRRSGEKPPQAWQITTDNIHQVAAWCGGRVVGEDSGHPEVWHDTDGGERFEVMAEPGDWVIIRDGRVSGMSDWMFQRDIEVIQPGYRMPSRGAAQGDGMRHEPS